MATDTAKPRHSPETIDRALLEIALTGSARKAAHNLDLPERTVSYWRTEYHERYQEIAEQQARKVEDTIVIQARDSAILAGQLERDLLISLAAQADELPAKEKAAAVRNLATAKGINIDKLLTLTGRPNQISETRSADDLIRRLESLQLRAIDSTADEIPPAALVAESCGDNARETSEDQAHQLEDENPPSHA